MAASKNDSDRQSHPRKQQRFHYSFLKIFSGSELARRRMPYMQVHSVHPGPTVWLTACCHGDEVGGIVVVQEVFRRLRKRPLLKGAIHAFPLMNPLGFETAQRHVTLSEEDLNRAFPGSATGTLAERIADLIYRTIASTEPEVVLDLHNDWIRSIPYTVLDPPVATEPTDAERRAASLAAETGFPVVVEPNPMRRTLSHSLLRRGTPAITIELGESYVVNETNVGLGVDSVFNVLGALGMVRCEGEPFRFRLTSDLPAQPLRYSQQPASSTSGILRFLVRPGARVHDGQPIGKIVNAFGRLQETLAAPGDGIVLGLSDSAVAFPGAPVMAFGLCDASLIPRESGTA